MKKHSDFRMWVNDLYNQNCKEREEFKEPCIESEKYFNQYKWWLKREFKFQMNKEK